MKPWRKNQVPPVTPTETPKLRLVTGGETAKRPGSASSYGLIFAFLGVAAAVIAVITYFSPSNRWRWETMSGTFSSLEEAYKKGGMQKFQEQKALLKRSVGDALKEGKDQAQVDLATNIAVYLFPDALPSENFEKPVAEEMWGETFTKIEKAPHTAESRVLFEALRADIWNYEMVDREDPKLSAPARQVIQIYDTISAP